MRLQRWLAYYAVLSGEWHSQGLGLLVGLRAPKSLGDSCLIVALIACQNMSVCQGNTDERCSSESACVHGPIPQGSKHTRRGTTVSHAVSCTRSDLNWQVKGGQSICAAACYSNCRAPKTRVKSSQQVVHKENVQNKRARRNNKIMIFTAWRQAAPSWVLSRLCFGASESPIFDRRCASPTAPNPPGFWHNPAIHQPREPNLSSDLSGPPQ